MTAVVRIQREDFSVADEVAALTRGRSQVGAVVTFTGLCRDEGGRLAALELEHYPGMAEAEIERVVAEARGRWPLHGVTVVHRFGKIAPGENIVLVVAASAHRHAAFEAAEFLMDYLKTRAPFWKREHLAEGGLGEWVEARGDDDAAAERWEASSMNGNFSLLRTAVAERKQVTCTYQGRYREICPHVLGWKDGVEKLLAFQFGGESSRKLSDEGEWRCMFVEEIRDIRLRHGEWLGGGEHRQIQSCIDVVAADAGIYPPGELVRAKSRDKAGQ